MSKLYIFAIGGTGSRVLRSLTMMLASGVKLGVDEIVPMIIDPDASNADLTRTILLLENYQKLRSEIEFPEKSENNFFRTEIDKYTNDYTLPVNNTRSQSFAKFIGLSNLNREDLAFVKMLFSDKNLSSSMDVGFKGDPNIGSVVLNEVLESPVFEQFDSTYKPDDKIFIINSIFGGTGASGFPMLLKALRESKKFKNSDTINKATIGAVTVLPYFTVGTDEKGDDEINSATFASKTKSALKYYETNIANNNTIDSLYLLGDIQTQVYKYSVGGKTQRNNAHLIEFMAASAIIDFSFKQAIKENVARQTTSYELGISDCGAGGVSFSNFGEKLKKMFRKPLTQFALMANDFDKDEEYLKESLKASQKMDDFFSSDFYQALHDFTTSFKDWIIEMEENRRTLKIFQLDCGDKPFNIVNGQSPEAGFIEKLKGANYGRFETVLNKESDNAYKVVKNYGPTFFIEMFYRATEKLVKDKFKF